MLGAGLEPARLSALDPKSSQREDTPNPDHARRSTAHPHASTGARTAPPNAPRTFHREFHRRLYGLTALLAEVASAQAPIPDAAGGVQPVPLGLALTVRRRFVALRSGGAERGDTFDHLAREFDLSARTVAYLCLGAEPPGPAIVVCLPAAAAPFARAA